MKKLFRFLPVFTLGAGVACCLIQQSLFDAADEKGLISTGFAENFPLILLCVCFAALLAAYCFSAPKEDFRFLFPVQAIGCLAAAAGLFYWFLNDYETIALFHLIKLIAAFLFLALAFFRIQSQKAPLMIPALICLCMMLLCFSQYRQWGQCTQLLEYLFPALSALFIALYSLEVCYTEDKKFKKLFLLNQAALFCTLAAIREDTLVYHIGICLWLIGGLFCTPYRMVLPQDVQYCVDKLEKRGYTVYAVGGCVRDSMLGLTPNDYDLCTNATPEQICQVFDKHRLVRSGEKHGTIGVVLGEAVYEITTYRTEGSYADNRHPDQVTFVSQVEEDLARRDFTVNAMAFHPKTGYVDPFGGKKDLFSGILRAVGQPEVRFQEDALRILRGVRFACRFRLTPEEKTLAAMEKLAPLMENLASERIYSELTQTLCHIAGDDLIRYRKVLLTALPELESTVDFQQHTPHHAYDVFVHTARVLSACEPEPALRWAALLHDAGKPAVFTLDETNKGHFYGHAQESAQIADAVLLRLKAPTALREQVNFLITHHMEELKSDKNALRRKLSKYGGENLRLLIQLQLADQKGKGTPIHGFDKTCEKMLRLVEELEQEEGRLQIRDLNIDGHDLMALGFEAGPALGECQKKLLEMVLNGEVPNEKAALTEKAKEILEH